MVRERGRESEVGNKRESVCEWVCVCASGTEREMNSTNLNQTSKFSRDIVHSVNHDKPMLSMTKNTREIICDSTCFSWGVAMKIVWTSLRISNSARSLSHSSRMKCFTLERSRTYSTEIERLFVRVCVWMKKLEIVCGIDGWTDEKYERTFNETA